jgi:hypothetical protein
MDHSRFNTAVNKYRDAEYSIDDTTFNFRVNGKLKEEFAFLCGRDRFSIAVALKRYMADCVRTGRIK